MDNIHAPTVTYVLFIVSLNNNADHFRLVTQWRFRRGIEEQTKAFLDGFNEVVPVNWLQVFDERELELMLCGMQELSVDEWEKHTVYKGYQRESNDIKWFWQVSG